ncbi:MAG: hypothetical protein M1826_006775 [Phylliscum demangeonii]|nr:MAG: hypothetical protein M1826_006775 [Phylliscum demangeonii]
MAATASPLPWRGDVSSASSPTYRRVPKTPGGGNAKTPALLVTNVPVLPRSPTDEARTPSPSYFGLPLDPRSDPANSYADRRGLAHGSPLSSSMRSVAACSPQVIAVDARPELEGLRRCSDGKTPALRQPAGLRRAPPADRVDRSLAEGAVPKDAAVHGHGGLPGLSEGSWEGPGDPMEIDPDPVAPPPPSRPPPSRRAFSAAPDASLPPGSQTNAAVGAFGFTQARSAHPEPRSTRLAPAPTQGPVALTPSTMPSGALHAAHGAHATRSASPIKAASPTKTALPVMMTAAELTHHLQRSPPTFLLLDVRVSPRFAESRIDGALNLCIPTTLLKRPSFNLQKLADTLPRAGDKARFDTWKTCQMLIAYDDRSGTVHDAVACASTLKKFANEGWQGTSYIVQGGFVEFAQRFPRLIDRSGRGSTPSSPAIKPTAGGPAATAAPVAGGCPMPATQHAANPFFSNIRQNMDLLDGVGQMAIKRPAAMTCELEERLPAWLRAAIEITDEGKGVSDRFLRIEQAEQRRMQAALSVNVAYGSPAGDGTGAIQIAGIEKGAKNRYNNIWPYDHARVKLQEMAEGSCDYINASHCKAPWSNRRYIATQGPMPITYQVCPPRPVAHRRVDELTHRGPQDFWSLVWEQDVRVIVMLTAEQEGGQQKCHPYWTGKDFGFLRLKTISEQKVALKPLPDSAQRPPDHDATEFFSPVLSPGGVSGHGDLPPHIIVRKFCLSHTSHPFSPVREITQLQYASWPDFNAPAHPLHVLRLLEHCDAVVRTTMRSSSSAIPFHASQPFPHGQRPVLVHCSAGCGRTGTFCTIDTVLDMLKRRHAQGIGAHPPPLSPLPTTAAAAAAAPSPGSSSTMGAVDTSWLGRDDLDLVEQTVEHFRRQRISMVQSLRQYVLCYETVLEWLVAQPQQLLMSRRHSRSGDRH